jgi:hypothetical protein
MLDDLISKYSGMPDVCAKPGTEMLAVLDGE